MENSGGTGRGEERGGKRVTSEDGGCKVGMKREESGPGRYLLGAIREGEGEGEGGGR